MPPGNASIHLASWKLPQARFLRPAKFVATEALVCYSIFCISTDFIVGFVLRERKDPR